MKYISVSLVLIILSGLISGCQNNIRLYDKDNIVAKGEIKTKTEALYHLIEIGHPGKPISEKNSFIVEFGDGTKFLLPNVSRKDIAALTSRENMTWGQYQVEVYSLNYTRFIFYGEKLVSVEFIPFITTDKPILKIRNPEMTKFYQMPLTQEQLFEIFGKPDKLQDAHVW